MCIAGRPHRQNCASTLHFNTLTNQCDHPSNTDCPVRKPHKNPVWTHFFMNFVYSKQNHPEPSPPPPTGFDCRAQEPLPIPLFPHPTNCSQFYLCDINDIAHLQTCGVNLLFSPLHQGCDVPERVTCAPGATKSLDESV